MSKWHAVTLHHVITVYNDIFDHMDGVMRALAKKEHSMEGRLIIRHEVTWTEAVKISH